MIYLSITLIFATGALALEPLKNVGYLASGYDIFFGNPKSTVAGTDPGFQTSIFDFKYDRGLALSDHTFKIPDHTSFRKNVGCTMGFQAESIQGTKGYVSSLKQEVGIEGSVYGVSFSASVDYGEVYKSSSSKNSRFTSSESECTTYDGTLDLYALPSFTKNFIAAVKSLPSQYEEDDYYKFLNTFGTHFVYSITMGAKYGVRTEISESSWKKMLSQRIKVAAAAQYNGLYSISASSLTEVQKEQAETFARLSESQKTFTIGSRPPADGKAETWSSQAIKEPMPLKYELKSLKHLFTAKFVGKFRGDYGALQSNIHTATNNYCKRLLARGQVSSCHNLPDDPFPPTIDNSCRFCSRNCGGYFPVDGGALSQDQDWPGWFLQYPNGCTGNGGRRYATRGRGSRLCCEKPDRNHLGGARICLSCGGDLFKYHGGKIQADQKWVNWASVYDHGCTSEPRNRPSGSGYSLCLSEKRICSLCSTCGGYYPHETSVLAYDQPSWKGFFSIRGRRCSGRFRSQSYHDGVSVCCRRMVPK